MTWWLFLNSGRIIPRKSWNVRGSHSETKIRVGFVYTAFSRKVVGKGARDKPERYCGRFYGSLFFKEIERMAREAMGV